MNRIKELRTGRGMKQTDLARQLGVTQGALSGWENENYEPDIKALKKMAEIFGVSVDYILCLTDEAAPGNVQNEPLVALSAPKGYDRLTEDERQEIEEIIAIYNRRRDS
ncbi:helix-turn-helix transcriptional regulator [Christensenella tenuis]|uniref:Helix-turn-helix transcriptional regulator n=1 Tax=Christensenella tenuis TaxID=2763033 RepID=A0ABR7EH01_9FIRM|nr:helix-turn-helix transcriptional regulator [Christensenella tenuis]MBC5649038.1 helix-turn-helix transcriptional regulator [Christensenella tenuis]